MGYVQINGEEEAEKLAKIFFPFLKFCSFLSLNKVNTNYRRASYLLDK